MRAPVTTLLIAVTLAASSMARQPSATLAQADSCGGVRSAIATLSDSDAATVSLQPLGQQVVDLNAWPPPPSLSAASRAPGIETHTYVVTAELLGTTLQSNGDFDLVLAQPGDHRWTITAVLPDPAKCQSAAASPEAADMQAARNAVASTVGLSSGSPITPTIVRVTGAGFFNPLANGSGEAKNFLELSPVIQFTLVGPAALSTFPILARPAPPPEQATNTGPVAGLGAAGLSQPPGQPPPPADQPAEATVDTNTATSASAAPAADVSQQQILSALETNAPEPGELPSPFASAVLTAAGPGTGPTADANSVTFLLLDQAGQQPLASLTYLIFGSADDAQSALMSLQQSISGAGAAPEPLGGYPSGSFCANAPSGAGASPCALQSGSVLVLTQAADLATSSAAAQAGVAHLAAITPGS
jgi:hypothetical protein